MIATLFLMLGGNAVKDTWAAGKCAWSTHAQSYSPGYAKGLSQAQYSLAEAQKRCLDSSACKAVTCNKQDKSRCTLRAGTQQQLKPSPDCASRRWNAGAVGEWGCDEYTYIPTCCRKTDTWRKHAMSYSPGYVKAAGDNVVGYKTSLAAAKKRCLEEPTCDAVTCEREEDHCTLRASSKLKESADCNARGKNCLLPPCPRLNPSPCNEYSYVLVQMCPSSACEQTWSESSGFYSPGYPDGYVRPHGFSGALAEAQKDCLSTFNCNAVTCQKKTSGCTLRGSANLKKSAGCNANNNHLACNEVSYVPTTWTVHPKSYSPGYPKGYVNPGPYSLAEARRRCSLYPGCEAVTCNEANAKCTLRASTDLIKSPSNEITFVHAVCKVPDQ